jgi:hypothetical protein
MTDLSGWPAEVRRAGFEPARRDTVFREVQAEPFGRCRNHEVSGLVSRLGLRGLPVRPDRESSGLSRQRRSRRCVRPYQRSFRSSFPAGCISREREDRSGASHVRCRSFSRSGLAYAQRPDLTRREGSAVQGRSLASGTRGCGGLRLAPEAPLPLPGDMWPVFDGIAGDLD